jgi:hypothetical protein
MGDLDVNRRVAACFSGRIARTCSSCIASSRCCFSERFDPDDDECVHCIHAEDCKMYSEQQARPSALSRPYTATTSIPRTVNITREPQVLVDKYHPDRQRLGGIAEPSTPLELFVKQTSWKAVEGFFLGAYEFFRRSRIW